MRFRALLLCAVLTACSHPSTPPPAPAMPDLTHVKAADAEWMRAVEDWNAGLPTTTLPPPVEGNTGAMQKPRGAQVIYGTGACGGDLPPCSVLECESGGNLVAQNPHSTASGKWQILDSTWAGYGGYSRAMYAPEEVQDAKARELWNGGRGAGQWVCK